MKLAILSTLFTVAAAFTSPAAPKTSTALEANRRDALAQIAAVGAAFVPLSANAVRDNDAVKYLGGGAVVDLNNANVRVYLKMPGLYPTIAGKIVSNGPYASVGDVYKIPGLSGKEQEIIKKYESRFTVTAPQADYVIDRINNGLYR